MRILIGLLAFLVSGAPTAASTISGTVRSLGGEPYPYANLLLVGTQYGAITDEAGAYALHGVPAGEYTVRVHQVTCPLWEGAVTVATNDVVSLDISLPCARLDDERVRFFGAPSDETISIMKSANRVLTFEVNPFLWPLVDDADPSLGSIRGFQLISTGGDLVGESVRTACDLLLAEENYLYDYSDTQKLCPFSPRHAFRFESSAGSVDVLVCFSCASLTIAGEGGGDFDPSVSEFAKLFEEAGLPRD